MSVGAEPWAAWDMAAELCWLGRLSLVNVGVFGRWHEKVQQNEAGEALGRVEICRNLDFSSHVAEYSNNYADFGVDLLDFFRETMILSNFG